MIKRIIIAIVDTVRQQISLYLFMLKVLSRGGVCGKGLHLSHPECVEFEKLKIKSGFRIDCYLEYAGVKLPPPILKIFNNVIIGYGFTALVAEKIAIGSNTILASNVSLVSENHGISVETDSKRSF
jgi:acetyltransferase-like isoleucine patch superfamily enzyme